MLSSIYKLKSLLERTPHLTKNFSHLDRGLRAVSNIHRNGYDSSSNNYNQSSSQRQSSNYKNNKENIYPSIVKRNEETVKSLLNYDLNKKNFPINASNYVNKPNLDKRSSLLNNNNSSSNTNSGYLYRETKFIAENQFNKSSKPIVGRQSNNLGLLSNNIISNNSNKITKPIYNNDSIFSSSTKQGIDKIVKLNPLNDTQTSRLSNKIYNDDNYLKNYDDDRERNLKKEAVIDELMNKEFVDKNEFSDILSKSKKISYNNLGGSGGKNNYSNYNNEKNNKDFDEITKEKDSYSKSTYSIGDNYQKQKSINIEKSSKGFVGLSNLGNTCYMNTSLQMLLNCDKFIKKLLTTKINEKSGITKEFKSLIQEYQQTAEKPSLYKQISPSSFKRSFEYTHKSFAGYNQQDSQEFMRKLLDDISSETNIVLNKAKFIEIDDRGKSKGELQNEYNKFYASREKSIVTDFFNGELLNTFICDNCNKETYSFQKIIDIPIYLSKLFKIIYELNLLASELGQSVESYLNNFFRDDNKIEWSVPCVQCKKKCYHTKKTALSDLPEYLMIVFQRYSKGRKCGANISFKNELDLSKYVDKDLVKNSNTEYTLKSVSNHSGSLNFGHYYA